MKKQTKDVAEKRDSADVIFDTIIPMIEKSDGTGWLKTWVTSSVTNVGTGAVWTGENEFLGAIYASFLGMRPHFMSQGKVFPMTKKGKKWVKAKSPYRIKEEYKKANGWEHGNFFPFRRPSINYVAIKGEESKRISEGKVAQMITDGWEIRKWVKFPLFKAIPIDMLERVDGKEIEVSEIVDGIDHDWTGVEGAKDHLMKWVTSNLRGYYEGANPSYSPVEDKIRMPEAKHTKCVADWTHILAHEVVHATGHDSRLNRFNKTGMPFTRTSKDDYATEELVAELGSLIICNELGIMDKLNLEASAAYVKGWLKAAAKYGDKEAEAKFYRRDFRTVLKDAKAAANLVMGKE